MTSSLSMAGAVVAWLLACAWFYRGTRRTPWLAGPSVTGALAMTGLTAIAATQVGAAWALAPVLLTNTVASVLHLLAAQRSVHMKDQPAVAVSAAPPARSI